MKILVACEESQAVTIELRKLGHEAYSCDLLPWKTKCTSPRKTEFELGSISWEGLPLSERGFYLGTPKPILRPMSSLIKPIIVDGYNEGKPFVPIEKLFAIAYPGNMPARNFYYEEMSNYVTCSHYGTAASIGIQKDGNNNLQWVNNLLRSWFFNVDGISEYLYVEIED